MSSGNAESSGVDVCEDSIGSSAKDTSPVGRESKSVDAGCSNEPVAPEDRKPAKQEDKSSPEDTPADSAEKLERKTEESPLQQSYQPSREHDASFQPHLHPFPYGVYQQPTQPLPSPTVPAGGGYGIQAMLFQQQAAITQQDAAATASPFVRSIRSGIPPLPPLSPAQSTANNAAESAGSNNIPASPLLTAPSPVSYAGNPLTHLDSPAISRMAESSMASPLSPVPYLPPQALPNSPLIPGYSGIYQVGYGGASAGYRNPNDRDIPNSPVPTEHDFRKTWSEGISSSPQHHGFHHDKNSQHLLPHSMMQHQVGLSSSDSNEGSHSFDEILPSPAISGRDPKQGPYSQNIPGQSVAIGPGAGGTLFPHPQPWGGYSANSRGVYDCYNSQQHGSWHTGNIHRQGGNYPGRHVGPPLGSPGHHAGQPYHSATTPGPPIQTSPSNKGPDGANLFIFHIPNHFTNLDMYNLFCHYGNLLSVRIMVEKDTGRSRGFGFVSYDSPEAAAMAIKELNGFVIGNKRLKVQHKQIRPNDQTGPHHHGFHHPPSVSAARKRDVRHSDMGTTESATSGPDGGNSAPVPNWYNAPTSPELASESSKPSAPPYTPLKVTSSSGTSPFHARKEDAGSNPHSDSIAKVDDKSLGMTSQVPSDHVPVPPSESTNGRSDVSQTGLSPFPAAAAGSSKSPLGHLESIRSALPDVPE